MNPTTANNDMSNDAFLKFLVAFWAVSLGLALLFSVIPPDHEGMVQFFNVFFAFMAACHTFARACSCGASWQHLRETTRTGTIWSKLEYII
jgi:hypothetical protein